MDNSGAEIMVESQTLNRLAGFIIDLCAFIDELENTKLLKNVHYIKGDLPMFTGILRGEGSAQFAVR
jgi:hypothetical protein